ncbi:MAG TPA: lysylphosphatidylglycerol synthase transmembrane domain-containing protein, partial [Longimicrobiales bacterium]|nr:lysylphosphatidylglycerol synthase transmembrane domain-containing protein [Longimicrobiales bacterium]
MDESEGRPGRRDRRRLARTALQWVGTLVLGAYILSRTDLSAILRVLAGARPGWIGLAVLLLALDRLVAAFKWRILLRAAELRLPFGSVLSALLKGTFLGSALPATVGIDLIRARLATPPGVDYHRALGSVIVERAVGVASLLLAALVGVVAFAGPSLPEVARPLLVAAGGALAVAVILVVLPTRGWRLDPGGGSVPFRALRWLRTLRGHLRDTYRDGGLLAVVFGVALAQHYLVT